MRLTVFGSNSLHNPVLKGYRLSGWQRQLDPGGILLSAKKLGMACDSVAKTRFGELSDMNLILSL